MFQSIAHIGFTVSDLDCSVAFYRDVLGLSYLGEMKMGGPETAALFQRQGCEARVAYLQPADQKAPPVELIQFTDQKAESKERDKQRMFKQRLLLFPPQYCVHDRKCAPS